MRKSYQHAISVHERLSSETYSHTRYIAGAETDQIASCLVLHDSKLRVKQLALGTTQGLPVFRALYEIAETRVGEQ